MFFTIYFYFAILISIVFSKGTSEKTGIEYNGENTEDDLISFINANTGTMRIRGGGLSNKVFII